jgi:DNA-binding CsgD family transcriptional regulator
MSTLPLVAFFAFFGLAGLGVFLADRMFRARGQAFLRSYALHMAFWNGHALVMIMQFILGTEFLPRGSWASLAFVTGPVIILLAAVSMYFLSVFAAQAGGGKLPRLVSAVSVVLWAGLALYFVLKAGAGTGAPDDAAGRAYAAPFLALKLATVLGAMGYLLIRAGRRRTVGEGRALRLVAGTYVVGLLVFQLSVSGNIPVYRLPAHDYLIALIQVGFHFPVLAALALYARRRAGARPADAEAPDVSRNLEALGISPREAEIAGLVMRGLSNREIGAELFISLDTVKKHLSSIYQKAGVKSRLQLSLLLQRSPSLPSP